ncbi:MAG: glycerate kinase, partial [Bacilli bacterium]|nr:glycerate kinase [Bacilli bacterium]
FEDIERIDIGNLDKLKGCRFNIICDVTNPLVGPNGTSYTYAKQKGASLEEIEILEKGATHIAEIIYKEFGDDIENRPYYGCSGGIAMALSYFLNADIFLGSEYFSSLHKLDDLLDENSLVVTGEGKLDKTSFQGKVVSKIVDLAKRVGAKLLAIVGKSDLDKAQCLSKGINDLIVLNQDEEDFEVIKGNAQKTLYDKTLEYFSSLENK